MPSSVQTIPGQPPIVHYGTVDAPELNVAYEYHLFVHCGIRTATFGGHAWLATKSWPDGPRPRTVAAPVADDGNYLTGMMTLVAPDLARFEWDDDSAEFAPTDAPQPLCA